MIAGIVNADFEAIISLSICDSDGKIHTHEAIVDTSFNGWLSLPSDKALGFLLQCFDTVQVR
jgi:predicted aspartyl protease